MMGDDHRAYLDYSMAIHSDHQNPRLFYDRSCIVLRWVADASSTIYVDMDAHSDL